MNTQGSDEPRGGAHQVRTHRVRARYLALHWQLLATAAPLAAAAMFALAALADRWVTADLDRAAAVHLDAVRVAAEASVAVELRRLEDLARRVAADARTVAALRGLAEATRASEDDPRASAEALAPAQVAYAAHLQRWLAPRGVGSGPVPTPATSASARRALWLQAQYVSGSSAPSDGAYGRAHAAWHPYFAELTAREGLVDLILVRGGDGLVLYDVAKWPLFQTSLVDGPHAASPLGALLRRVRDASSPDAVLLADVAPVAAARGAALGFAAAPVVADGVVLGAVVAAFDKASLGRALSGGGRWQGLGLGVAGDLFMIGDDGRLRSAPRQPTATADASGDGAPSDGAPIADLANAAVGVARYGMVDGSVRLASIGPAAFGDLGWRIVAVRDDTPAATTLGRRLYSAAAFCALAFAAALAGLSWWLAVPLRHLTDALSRLRATDPRAHAPVLGRGDAAAVGLAVNRLLAQSRDEAAAARRGRDGAARALAAAVDAWPREHGGVPPQASGELAPVAAALARLDSRLTQAAPAPPQLAEVAALQTAAEHLRGETARQLERLNDTDVLAAAQIGAAAEARAALVDELGVLAVNAALAGRDSGSGAVALAVAARAAVTRASGLGGDFDQAGSPLHAARDAARRLCHAADIVAREAEAVAAAATGQP